VPAAALTKAARALGYVGADLTSGAILLHVIYRTERSHKADGSVQDGVSSALVLLPDNPRPGSGLVVTAHGTAGEADRCAPSREGDVLYVDAGQFDDARLMNLGLAGFGWTVISPDYAGLGLGGPPEGWSLSEDEAYSVLDATRAMGHLLAAKPTEVVIVGHSQGGHVALSAQALAAGYGIADGMTLVGVVGFAPLWVAPTAWGAVITTTAAQLYHINTRDNGGILGYGLYYFYGHGELYDGPGHGLDMFQEDKKPIVKDLMTNECNDQVYLDVTRLGDVAADFYDPVFIDKVGTCALTGSCDAEPAATWKKRFVADRPHLNTRGAKLVVWQGGMDATITPAFAQCGIDRINHDYAADPQATSSFTLCGDPMATHGSVVRRNLEWVNHWIDARLGGAAEPAACTQWVTDSCAPLPPND
jgi:pimeloyl-ACP methyl ester carboxylesterase